MFNCHKWSYRVILAFLASALAAEANTAWYRATYTYSANPKALTNPTLWQTADGTKGTATAFTANDDLMLVGKVEGTTRLRTTAQTVTANSLQVGEVDGAVDNELCLDPNSSNFTYGDTGLILARGNMFLNGNSPAFNFPGPITVTSPDARPFVLHIGQVAQSNATVNITGPLTGAAGTRLQFGNATRNTLVSAIKANYYLSNIANFKGTLSLGVLPSVAQALTGNDFALRVYLPVQTSEAAVIVGDGCEVGVNAASGEAKVSNVTLSSGSRLWVRGNGSAAEAACITASNTLVCEGGVRVTVINTYVRAGEYVPILRAPLTATFTAADFTLSCQANDFGVPRLVVRETDTARELCITGPAGTEEDVIWTQAQSYNVSGEDRMNNLTNWLDSAGNIGPDRQPGEHDRLISPGSANGLYRLRQKGRTFTGKAFQIGKGNNGTVFVQDNITTMTFPNEGLFCACGHYFINKQDSYWVNGPVTVLDSTATKRFVFSYGNHDYSNQTAYLSGPFKGSAKACVSFSNPFWDAPYYDTAPGTTYVLGDTSAYHGTMEIGSCNGEMSDTTFAARLLLDPYETDMHLRVYTKSEFGVARAGTLTVKNLELQGSARLYVGGTNKTVGAIAVTDTFTFPGTLDVRFDTTLEGVGIQRRTLLTAPTTSGLGAATITLITSAKCLNHNLVLTVEEDATAGTVSLIATAPGIVYQTKSLANEGARDWGKNSSLTNAASWSDNLPVHADSHYLSQLALHSLHGKDNPDYAYYTFPGLSLDIRKSFIFDSAVFSVPQFFARGTGDGVTVQLGNDTPSSVCSLVATNFQFTGRVNLIAHAGNSLRIVGPICGSGEMWLNGSSGVSDPRAQFELVGTNTAYKGRMVVERLEKRLGDYNGTGGSWRPFINFEEKFVRLYVNFPESLGGALDEFNPRALTLMSQSRLEVTNTARAVTFDTVNRGLYILQCGRLCTAANARLNMNVPVLQNGDFWKEGAGTVTLGGALSHETAAGGISETPVFAESNNVYVAGGTLLASHVDALRGANVIVSNSVTLGVVFNPDATADLRKYGIRNTCAENPLTLAPGAKLSLAVDANGAEDPYTSAVTVGLMTVANTAADAVETALRAASRQRMWGLYPHFTKTVNADETTTFALTFKHIGAHLIFR